MHIHIYNYNTMERIKSFEAHTDYIRSLAIHPSKPYVLSSSDDMYIKLWDWEADWECRRVFEGHTHYVMQVEFNPKDTNTFCSASLDRSVKVCLFGFGCFDVMYAWPACLVLPSLSNPSLHHVLAYWLVCICAWY